MNLAQKILTNKEYQALVEKIENIHFITDGKWDWEHGIGHYKKALYTRQILMQLKEEERIIQLATIAALLHDIGLSKGDKIDHAKESSILCTKFIDKKDVTKEELEMIKQAIADHSNGNNINSSIALALVLADKLDVTYHRVLHSTIKDEINTEILKIKKVDIKITEKDLNVQYKVEESFDPMILNHWKKAITIPEKAAKYLNKTYTLQINGKPINYKNIIHGK